MFKVQAVPAQPHGQHGGGTSIFPKVRLISFTEMDMLFGNNFTQGRNHGRRKDYFPAEGTLAGKRRKVFVRSDGIFDSFGWESIGLYIIDISRWGPNCNAT